MRRLVRWIAGLVSLAALAKLLGRRHREHIAPAPVGEADPADELRRKLAEARASSPPADDEQAASPPADAPADDASAGTIEERRAAIHARAQEAIDAMREGGEP